MKELFTEIIKANIFRSGAQVVRRGIAELSEGTQSVCIHALTRTGKQETVQLFCSEGLSCTGLRFKYPDISELENPESEKLREEIDLLKNEMEFLNAQSELWQTNGDFTGSTTISASDMEDYLNKLPDRLIKNKKRIKECADSIKKLEKKLKEANEKEILPLIIAEMTAEKAGTYAFEVKYYENSAQWEPIYEIRSDGKEPLEIRMRASIKEYSFEDWNNVEISLFTGNPASGRTMPELYPLFLSIYEPAPVRPMRRMAAKASACDRMPMDEDAMVMEDAAPMAMAMGAAMPGAPMMEISTTNANVQRDEALTEYSLPGRKDIPKGMDGIMADLQTIKLSATYRIQAAAALDTHAYLTADIKLSELPITEPITAEIYLKNVYTGKAALNPDQEEDSLRITLGTEERLRITRKEVSHNISSTFFKGQKTVEHVYETKVINTADTEIEVFLKDQLPVTEDKSITVELLSPGDITPDKETGLFEVPVKVGPARTETFRLSYKISWPKDKKIRESRRM